MSELTTGWKELYDEAIGCPHGRSKTLYAQPPIPPDVAELQRNLSNAIDAQNELHEQYYQLQRENAELQRELSALQSLYERAVEQRGIAQLSASELQRQLEKAGWISIKEKPLPDCEGTYLIANNKGQVCPIIRGIIQNNVGSCFDWQYGEAITHWMPLPSAPTTDQPKESI